MAGVGRIRRGVPRGTGTAATCVAWILVGVVLGACHAPARASELPGPVVRQPERSKPDGIERDVDGYLMLASGSETTDAAPAAGGGAAELARKLQDPLANIKALMTDNAIGFDTGTSGDTSFGFQLQPIYAIDFPDKGFTLIPRAVIPIMGLEPGTDVPPVGQPTPPGSSRVWGLGDSVLQAFYAPHTKGKWKWGVGPQVSLKTRTDSRLGGPGWGAGVVGVVVGEIAPNVSFAGILGNLWGFEGDFNSAIIQPMVFYNFPTLPGAYIAYNAVVSADWNASSSNTWTVPLGFSVGKTFDMGKGNGLDVMIGPYYNAVRPDGAAGWQIRFGLTWVFP